MPHLPLPGATVSVTLRDTGGREPRAGATDHVTRIKSSQVKSSQVVTRMGAGAFGYVPLAGERRWTLLVTNGCVGVG